MLLVIVGLVAVAVVLLFIYYRYVSTGSTLPALYVPLPPSVDSVLVFCTEAGEAG